ncbi:MAG: PAS domain-containing protein [Candidatus Aminicenantes bacterium]|nr:PAS domain-containing protein [Candidatus Aminicenantes bacterium]
MAKGSKTTARVQKQPQRKECIECARKLEHDLKERIKELECLYIISSQIEAGKGLKQVLEQSASHLVKGFQYPEKARGCIMLDRTRYPGGKNHCADIVSAIRADIVVNGLPRGYAQVAYREKGEFLEEEKKLIGEIGRMISKAVEKHELQLELQKYVGKLKEMVKDKTRELEKSTKRFEDLFENAPDGIVISELNGDILKANRAFYRMLHYPEDGSVHLNFVKDKLYANIPLIRPFIFKKLKEKGFLEGMEMSLIDSRGKQCPVIGSFILVDFDGRRCIEEVYKDIRLRKELEQELIKQNENLEKIVQARTADLEMQKDLLIHKNEELVSLTEKLKESWNKLQTLFDAITDQVVMIDRDFNVKMANRKEGNHDGKCYAKIFGRSQPCQPCPGAMAFQQRKSITLEEKIADDYYLLQAYPIFDERGEVDGVLEFSRLITKQKNMELQLMQTDKLASLGQLVSGIAHEINNPNTFIRGNVSIIQEAMKDILPILDEHSSKKGNLQIARLNYDVFRSNILILLEDMAQGANRIKAIVDGLRKFAKRDDGVLNDEVDLNEIIHSCLRLVSNQIGRKAKVTLELDERLPRIKGNFQRLEQVLVNILINASQAIEKKMGSIAVRTEYLEKENENLLQIRDNGSGIDEKTLKQIFDPFFTTKRNQGGTGLGLSIAYGIIKDHKGRIAVDSKVGAGTTFSIHIPLAPRATP